MKNANQIYEFKSYVNYNYNIYLSVDIDHQRCRHLIQNNVTCGETTFPGLLEIIKKTESNIRRVILMCYYTIFIGIGMTNKFIFKLTFLIIKVSFLVVFNNIYFGLSVNI